MKNSNHKPLTIEVLNQILLGIANNNYAIEIANS